MDPNGDVALHVPSHGTAVMCSPSETDLLLMTGMTSQPAELRLCARKEESIRLITAAWPKVTIRARLHFTDLFSSFLMGGP